MADRVPCVGCGREILAATAAKNDGHCRQCRPTEAALLERQNAWKYDVGIGIVVILLGLGAWALFLSNDGMRMKLWLLAAPAIGLFFIAKGLFRKLAGPPQ